MPIVVDTICDAAFMVDREWRFRYLNDAAADVLGNGEDLVGEVLWEREPRPMASVFIEAFHRAVAEGKPQRAMGFSPSLSGWFEADAYPHEHGLTVIFRSCTELRRAEFVERLCQRAESLVEDTGTPAEAMLALGRLIRESTGCKSVAAMYLDDPNPRILSVEHADDPAVAAFMRSLDNDAAAPLLGKIGHNDAPVLVEDLHLTLEGEHGVRARAAELATAILLPLPLTGGLTAVVALFSSRPAGEDDNLGMLTAVHPRLVELANRVRSRQQLSQVFDLAGDGLCILDGRGRLTRANPSLCRILDRTQDDLLGEPLRELIHPADAEVWQRELDRALAAGVARPFECRIVTGHGTVLSMAWSMQASVEEQRIYAVARDVTGARRARDFEDDQRKLLSSIAMGEPLEAILDRLVEGVPRWIPEGRGCVVTVDERQRLVAVTRRTMPADYLDAIYPLPVAEDNGSCGAAAFSGEIVVIPDVDTDPRTRPYCALNRQAGVAACWSVPIKAPSGNVLGVLTVYPARPGAPTSEELAMLTDGARLAGIAMVQHRFRSRLRDSLQRLQLLGDALSEVAWDWNLDTDECWVDERAPSLFGWTAEADEAIERWWNGMHPADLTRVRTGLDDALSSGDDYWTDTYRFVRPDGVQVTLSTRGRILRDTTGQPLRMVGGTSHASAQNAADIERLRAQRLESLGSLAGGIAHDLNNVLTPILMASGLLLARHPLAAEGREFVELIRRNAERGSHMVKQVVTFARGASQERRTVRAADLVDEVVAMVRDSFLRRIEIRVDIAEDLPGVRVDTTLIHQVLVNLCVNARDAMPDGGVLTIRADTVDVELDADVPDRLSGRFVRIAVADNGAGIPDEVRKRLFEPFFTTKPPGEGTGLGLPTSLNIVESHSGFITVESELHIGSTFSIHLPAELAHTSWSPTDLVPAPGTDGDGYTVLLVDDEVDLLDVAASALRAHGFRIYTAANGVEALELIRRGVTVDVVVTDLMMPVMDGQTMLPSLRRLQPEVPVIAATGLEVDRTDIVAMLDEQMTPLQKPYSTLDLLTAIEAVLEL